MFKTVLNLILRVIVVFIVSALSVIGAGAIVGVDAIQASIMAGILGVARVLESLGRAFLRDGHLSLTDINKVFRQHSEDGQA